MEKPDFESEIQTPNSFHYIYYSSYFGFFMIFTMLAIIYAS